MHVTVVQHLLSNHVTYLAEFIINRLGIAQIIEMPTDRFWRLINVCLFVSSQTVTPNPNCIVLTMMAYHN